MKRAVSLILLLSPLCLYATGFTSSSRSSYSRSSRGSTGLSSRSSSSRPSSTLSSHSASGSHDSTGSHTASSTHTTSGSHTTSGHDSSSGHTAPSSHDTTSSHDSGSTHATSGSHDTTSSHDSSGSTHDSGGSTHATTSTHDSSSSGHTAPSSHDTTSTHDSAGSTHDSSGSTHTAPSSHDTTSSHDSGSTHATSGSHDTTSSHDSSGSTHDSGGSTHDSAGSTTTPAAPSPHNMTQHISDNHFGTNEPVVTIHHDNADTGTTTPAAHHAVDADDQDADSSTSTHSTSSHTPDTHTDSAHESDTHTGSTHTPDTHNVDTHTQSDDKPEQPADKPAANDKKPAESQSKSLMTKVGDTALDLGKDQASGVLNKVQDIAKSQADAEYSKSGVAVTAELNRIKGIVQGIADMDMFGVTVTELAQNELQVYNADLALGQVINRISAANFSLDAGRNLEARNNALELSRDIASDLARAKNKIRDGGTTLRDEIEPNIKQLTRNIEGEYTFTSDKLTDYETRVNEYKQYALAVDNASDMQRDNRVVLNNMSRTGQLIQVLEDALESYRAKVDSLQRIAANNALDQAVAAAGQKPTYPATSYSAPASASSPATSTPVASTSWSTYSEPTYRPAPTSTMSAAATHTYDNSSSSYVDVDNYNPAAHTAIPTASVSPATTSSSYSEPTYSPAPASSSYSEPTYRPAPASSYTPASYTLPESLNFSDDYQSF